MTRDELIRELQAIEAKYEARKPELRDWIDELRYGATAPIADILGALLTRIEALEAANAKTETAPSPGWRGREFDYRGKDSSGTEVKPPVPYVPPTPDNPPERRGREFL